MKPFSGLPEIVPKCGRPILVEVNDGEFVMMSAAFGRHAIVIGAGMGGLAAAAALAHSFRRVTVLERDTLRSDPLPRPGAPQSSQVHGLLGGGQRALGPGRLAG